MALFFYQFTPLYGHNRSGRQKLGISLDFCLLRWSRAPFLKEAADKIQAFLTEQLRPPAAQEQIPHPRALHFIKKATCRNGMSQAT
ncbi:MAG: hypothetical protein U0L25_01285 [Ligilactobacillus ruminis]|nr:hypothetical protein [Ligilactobacillus ruminis]